MAKYSCPKCGGPQFACHQTVREVQLWHFDDSNKRWLNSDNYGYEIVSIDLVYCRICHYDLNPLEIAKFNESRNRVKP